MTDAEADTIAAIGEEIQYLDIGLRDLAAALETVIASLLIGAQDPDRAMTLLRAAQSMAAAIHGSIDDATEEPQA